MNISPPSSSSPRWGSTTKMVIGLAIVGLIAALLVQFRQIIGPILLALILSFLLHPIIARLSTLTKISWRGSVNLIYLLLIIILAGAITATGYGVIQQTQSLYTTIQAFVNDLPNLIANLSTHVYTLGPFKLDFSSLDLTSLAEQLLGMVQPLLGRAGGLVSTLATSAAATMGWGFFVLVISYFLLAESGRMPENLLQIDIPGYNADTRRLGRELGHIWGAFLRGQMVISLMVILAYTFLLTILGVRFTLAIALMAGAARFVPWVGPLITWLTTALVAFLQGSNYFGLEPIKYTLLVVVACLILDQIFDNLVVPRMLGRRLGVHPAGVLIAAIIVTRLIGIVGLVLAAPVLATINLLSRYILRKMLDLEPFPEPEKPVEKTELSGERLLRRLKAVWRFIRRTEVKK